MTPAVFEHPAIAPFAINSAGDVEKQAKLEAQTHCITAWEAMGRIWFRKCRKVRKAA